MSKVYLVLVEFASPKRNQHRVEFGGFDHLGDESERAAAETKFLEAFGEFEMFQPLAPNVAREQSRSFVTHLPSNSVGYRGPVLALVQRLLTHLQQGSSRSDTSFQSTLSNNASQWLWTLTVYDE